MPLMGHEKYPNLIVKAKVFTIENLQELVPERVTTYEEDTLIKLWNDSFASSKEFWQTGDLKALEQAISQSQTIINTIPGDHPLLPGVLGNLGWSLTRRFEQLGQLVDLNEGIEMFRRSINLIPDDHPDKPARFNDLGMSFRARFGRLGDLADLDDAILKTQAATRLAPDGYPGRPIYLSNLGMYLGTRFERLGNVADLDDSIAQTQAAIHLIPDGSPDKPMLLRSLGISLHTRFEKLGNVADLANAIVQKQAAIHLIPDGHPSKPMHLDNLGSSLGTQFGRVGNLGDLDNAIAQIQTAVRLTPDDQPDKPMYLSNLGISLRARFDRLGNLTDINEAIVQIQAAVHLTPDGHPDKPMYLSNLGNSLEARFVRLGTLSDLDGAIAQKQAAVDLTPDGHPNKTGYLNNFGNSLRARFERLKNPIDLDNAITQIQTAVNLAPDSYPDKHMYLNSLGRSLRTRFERLRDPDDLNNAILQYQAAVDLTLDTHPAKTEYLVNLAKSFQLSFHQLNQLQHAEVAINHLSVATTNPVGPPSIRFEAAEQWISTAATINHTSLLTAYGHALELIPLVAWLGLPLVDRHQHLAKMGGIARDAAAAAISLGKYDKALEWLEQGRSVVWTQILQLRTPVDELREVNPNLADRLLEISRLLEQGSGKDISGGSAESIEEQGRRYRALTMERESIINQVRSLPNFNNFLRPKSSHYLMKAARNGPVVILNIATKRCDALAIFPGRDDITHIPLPNITSEQVAKLRDELKDFLFSTGIRSRGERAAMKFKDEADEQGCERVLAELWNNLVQPVLSSLTFSVRSFSNTCWKLLIVLPPASSGCPSPHLVVCHGTAGLPADSCGWFI
jgi:tetratricopeptide (TPR) repeat protein